MTSQPLALVAGDYRIEITDDPTYSVASADNVRAYDHEYVLCSVQQTNFSSRHAVCVTDKTDEVSSCVLLADGGVSGVHMHSGIVYEDSCIVAVGAYLASIDIHSLALQWVVEVDTATCFGVYWSEKQQCFISHGELEIARVSVDGRIVWRSSGADIFTNGFTMAEDYVRVVDWNNKIYKFDIRNGAKYEV